MLHDGRDLEYGVYLSPQHLEECLAHIKHLRNICLKSELFWEL